MFIKQVRSSRGFSNEETIGTGALGAGASLFCESIYAPKPHPVNQGKKRAVKRRRARSASMVLLGMCRTGKAFTGAVARKQTTERARMQNSAACCKAQWQKKVIKAHSIVLPSELSLGGSWKKIQKGRWIF